MRYKIIEETKHSTVDYPPLGKLMEFQKSHTFLLGDDEFYFATWKLRYSKLFLNIVKVVRKWKADRLNWQFNFESDTLTMDNGNGSLMLDLRNVSVKYTYENTANENATIIITQNAYRKVIMPKVGIPPLKP